MKTVKLQPKKIKIQKIISSETKETPKSKPTAFIVNKPVITELPIEEKPKLQPAKHKGSGSLLVIEELLSRLKTEFAIVAACVYKYSNKSIEFVQGNALENDIVINNYFSFGSPTIILSPVGLICNRDYKSRYVSTFIVKDNIYLVCLSSYVYEAFKGNEKFIEKEISESKRKLGELI